MRQFKTTDEAWTFYMDSAERALAAANNQPSHLDTRFNFSQIAMANVMFARELREYREAA